MMKKSWFFREMAATIRIVRSASAPFSLLLLILSLLGLPSVASAQTTAVAEVHGVVTDQSGAAIPTAQVVITQTDKDMARLTSTDATGYYLLPELPIGPYKLEVKAKGFKDYIQRGIVLQVAQSIGLNVTLQVGATTQTIEVTAGVSQVETRENAVAEIVDQRRVNELPLNNRQETQLILISGAAVYADAGDTGTKTFYSSTRISVAGGQGNGTAYLLDGGDFTDPMSNVNMPTPFPDATQEFSIETSAVSSRFGTHPGATVNIVTKSGTNALHGDLFDYLRNGDFNARNFFSANRDSLKRNQFGGTIGGKIITDKLFFFAGYQGTRNKSNPAVNTTHIPTAQMLNGDFTTFASPTCNSGKQVTLAAPFVGNTIATTALNPIAVTIATKYLPEASANSCGLVTYGIPITGNEDQEIGHIDYVRNAKHTIAGRWLVVDYRNPPTFNGTNLLTTTQAGSLERAQSATISDNYTVSSTTLNSFHLSWNRVRDNRGPTSIPINFTMLGANIYSAVPNFLLISSITGGFGSYCGTCAPGHFNFTSEQLADDLDVIRGRHQFSFGFNFIRLQNDTVSGYDENGAYTFNGSVSGLGLADLMIGRPSDFTQTNATPDDLRQSLMSFYAQDSFRVSNHLTLNYGVRWEPTTSDPDKYGRGDSFSVAGFLAGTISKVNPAAPPGLSLKGDPGIPPGMWNGHLANFGPRVGIVWDPTGSGKQTLRAGGAILYDSTETWFNERETTNPPFGSAIDIPTPPGGLSNPYLGFPSLNHFPGGFFPTSAGVYINMPLNPKPTNEAEWNVTYQRQFAHGWMVSASYLANKTTHLWISQEQNPAVYVPGNCVAGQYGLTAAGACSTTVAANVAARRRLTFFNSTTGLLYSSINGGDDGANSHYEGLLLSVQHRFEQNFTFLSNYTDSYCLSDYDFGAALGSSANSQPFNRKADYGPCISDIRRNFNISLVALSDWKMANRWAGRFLNHWELAPLLRATSGQTLNVTTGTDNSRTGLGNDRPLLNLGVSPYTPTHNCSAGTAGTCVQWLNSAAFQANPIGTFGDVSRNGFRGPGLTQFDTSLSRSFKLSEHWTMQARADAFNVINHTNFAGSISPAGLVSSFSTLSTGLSSSASFGKINSAFDPRIIQFSLKLIF